MGGWRKIVRQPVVVIIAGDFEGLKTSGSVILSFIICEEEEDKGEMVPWNIYVLNECKDVRSFVWAGGRGWRWNRTG